jgi:hypothetical protein
VPVLFTSSSASLSVLPRLSLSCPLLLLLLLLLLLAPMGIVERIVDLSVYPQAVQKHSKLSRYGHRCSFLGVLASSRSYLFSMTP